MLSKDNKDQPLATKDASFDSVLHLAVNAAAVQREGKEKKGFKDQASFILLH